MAVVGPGVSPDGPGVSPGGLGVGPGLPVAVAGPEVVSLGAPESTEAKLRSRERNN